MRRYFNNVANYYKSIVIGCAAMSLIPLIIISIYSRPSADDYSYAKYLVELLKTDYNPIQLIWAAVKVDINAWKTSDGPFLSQIIMTLQPGIYGEKYYFIGAIGIFIFVILALWLSFRNICIALNVKKEYSVIFSFAVSALIFNGMPSISEGVYWFDGAWNYTPFLFLTLLNVSVIFRNFVRNDSSKFNMLGMCSLAFVSSGGNFIVTYLNVILMFTVVGFAIFYKKYRYCFPFIFAFGGFCLEFFSPGTQARTASGFDHPSIIAVAFSSVKGCYAYICTWTAFQWIMYVTVVAILTFEIVKDINVKKMMLNPMWIIIYTILLEVALLFLPYYANGGVPVGRILNVNWTMYMILTGVTVAYFVIWIKSHIGTIINDKYETALCVACIIATIGMCGYNDSNSIKAINELSDGTAQEYARLCDIRYEMMANASVGDELECEPLIQDTMLFFADLDENPEDWKNEAWKSYYGVGMHVVRKQ